MENGKEYQKIVEEVKKYGKLKFEYAKLIGIEKLSLLFSAIAVSCIVTIFILVALFYMASALRTWLSIYMDDAISYIILAVLFLLFGGLVIIFKKQLVVNPVCRLVSKIFIDKKD